MKDISLHILDVANNSISAGASLIEIEVDHQPQNGTLTITIRDNGKGMSAETLAKVTDPFYTTRTTRKVGLGLPLIKQNAEQTGGNLSIHSEEGKGTILTVLFNCSHIDCPPIGNIAEIMTILITGNPKIDFLYTHKIGNAEFKIQSQEIKEILRDVPINSPQIVKFIKEMLEENIEEINNCNSNQ
ncbi:MAG TPA: ATP-binding protein [Salinivirgaceae bacterium]|nr:ATP-binding protein [Salinivirgaceae bacterium]